MLDLVKHPVGNRSSNTKSIAGANKIKIGDQQK